jgi:hypothetical protein
VFWRGNEVKSDLHSRNCYTRRRNRQSKS